MEEFDDLVPEPDEEGGVDMSQQGWRHLDEVGGAGTGKGQRVASPLCLAHPSRRPHAARPQVIWKMGLKILSLNVSYNKLEELPEQLGDLILLKVRKGPCLGAQQPPPWQRKRTF